MKDEMLVELIQDAIAELSGDLQLMKDGRFEQLPVLAYGRPVVDELDADAFSRLEPKDSPWQAGVVDNGLQSRRFCCFWHGDRLNLGIVMPLGGAYDTDEMHDEQRNAVMAACSMALLLLNHELKDLPFAQNNPEAVLTAVCDADGGGYVLYDGETLLAEDASWDGLLRMLQNELDGDSENKIIVFP